MGQPPIASQEAHSGPFSALPVQLFPSSFQKGPSHFPSLEEVRVHSAFIRGEGDLRVGALAISLQVCVPLCSFVVWDPLEHVGKLTWGSGARRGMDYTAWCLKSTCAPSPSGHKAQQRLFLNYHVLSFSLITKAIHIHGPKFGKYRKAQKKFIHILLLGSNHY